MVYFREQNNDFVTNLGYPRGLRCLSGVVAKPLFLQWRRNSVGEGRITLFNQAKSYWAAALDPVPLAGVHLPLPLQRGNTTAAMEYHHGLRLY